MGWYTLIQIILQFVTHLFLPGYLLYDLWKQPGVSRFKWLVKGIHHSSYVFYIFLAGRWDIPGYYLRYMWVVLLILAALISYRQVRALTFYADERRTEWEIAGRYAFTFLLFLLFISASLRGYFPPDNSVHLRFPLRDGRYYVAQGGNVHILNQHYPVPAQRFALDIVALNAAGIRARGMYPSDIHQYMIFARDLYSPCDGTVIKAVDGLPDLPPPERDVEHLAGNYVVIVCQDVSVLMAHMQKGSLTVRAGDTVTTEQVVGRVGNSGNTTEPHLHIHAVRGSAGNMFEGEGVPMFFEEKFPARNTLFVR